MRRAPESVHKGVYVLRATTATLEQRCAVMSAAHPTGFVTGPTAGALSGVRRMPRTSSLHYAVRHGLHLPEEPGVHFRQTTKLPATHRFVRDDGISIARPARLAFDLAADLRPLDHLSVVQQLLEMKRVSIHELLAIGNQLCHPGRDGSKRFRETLERLGGETPAQSHPEVVLAEALRDRGVPVERQARVVRGAGGVVVHIDLALPPPGGASSSTSIPSTDRSKVTPATHVDIAVSTRSTGRSSQSAKQTWTTSIDWLPNSRRCITLDAGACRTTRVFPDGRIDRRHSVDRKHSGGVGSGSGGGG